MAERTIPVVDLTALLDKLGGEALDLGAMAASLREDAVVLRQKAAELDRVAGHLLALRDGARQLRDVLDGGPHGDPRTL